MIPVIDERSQKLKALFDEAIDLPREEQAAFIDQQCGDDEELRRQLLRILEHDSTLRDQESFLRSPFDRMQDQSGGLKPGDVIAGRYTLERILGEGGMGVVWLATQEQPNRTVALKVLRSGLPSERMLRRFQFEAEVLGQLQHPGIAHVYEAATATVGAAGSATIRLPYFAMEYIRGESLTAYADHRTLTTPERLELVAKICDAVEHAHQKGVIHRDLKPGNILVDESAQPKVLDFGVARATGADVELVTTQTGLGQFMGTVPYMSPEQVTGDPTKLDTRSDVYALGVILHELLVGVLPHNVSNLSMPEAARVIRDEEPARLGSINTAFRGELETIVAKALEKDKSRRYQSASALAADIRRFLRGEAIEAKRDSAVYVLRKAVARYRGWVAAGLLLVVLLAAFGVVSTIQAERNRIQARHNQQLAEGLATALAHSNVERGRLLTRTDHVLGAEDLIWREHLMNAHSNHTYWALWELYSQNPDLTTFAAHDGEVREVVFAPDGRTFVSCSADGSVKIWDSDMFQPIAALLGHTDGVFSVAWSPNGQWIASASADGTVMVWDVATAEPVHTLRGHRGAVMAIDFVTDGDLLVSGGRDGDLRVWDVTTGECVKVLREHQAPVLFVRYNREAQVLATASGDGVLKVWRSLTGPSIATLTEGSPNPRALAISPDGQRLASGGAGKLVTLWEFADPPRAEILGTPNNGTVKFLAFAPDGETLLSGGWFRIDRWDLATRRRHALIGHGAMGGSMRPDGRMVIVAWGPALRVVDTRIDAGMMRLGGRTNAGAASISPDGHLIACGDNTNHVRLWETTTGRLLARLPSPTGRWTSARFHPSGEQLATCGADGVARLWDLNNGSLLNTIEGIHVATAQSLDFSPDGSSVAVTRRDETIQILALDTGRVLMTLPSLGSESLSVRFSPDGFLIVTGHRGNEVALWSATGELLGTLDMGATPWTFEFRPDGRKLAVGCWGQQFQILDLESRTLEARIGEAKKVVWGAAYMPTNTDFLATCCADGSVRLWDLNRQRNVVTLEPFGGSDSLSVLFTPHGKTLVAAGFDGSLCVWDLEYYDRHIAGNLEYQIDRFRDELGGRIQTESLRAWAENVRRRPWPRIGPHAADRAVSSEAVVGPHGVDPETVAAWGRTTLSQ